MYIDNPRESITPEAIKCKGTAEITLGFEAGPALYSNPADFVLLIDRSVGISQEEMAAVKTAAKQFISYVADASNIPDSTFIGSNSTMLISSFADTVITNKPKNQDVAPLKAAVDAIEISSSKADYKKAFEEAEKLFLKQKGQRRIVVLVSHSAESALADADPVVSGMKSRGVELYCIGLLSDPAKLKLWASDSARDHVSYTDNYREIAQSFHEIAAEVVLAGILEGELTETVGPDFKIVGYDAPTDGKLELLDDRTLSWTIPDGAMSRFHVRPEITFRVQHVGSSGGLKTVSNAASYHDRYGNRLDFPAIQAEIECSETGTVIYPEPCPEATELTAAGCRDAAQVELPPVGIQGLGRIIQTDVTIKSVCPGKRVAVSLLLMEIAADGSELPRGVKHILVPAQTGESCKDITLKCIQFSLPESLDADGSADSICNSRKFSARVIANYIDTDFSCCEAESVIN